MKIFIQFQHLTRLLLLTLFITLNNHSIHGQAAEIELGISYDDALINKFGSEQAVKTYLSIIMDEVNCINVDLNPAKYAVFKIAAFRKFNLKVPVSDNKVSALNGRLAASEYWYFQQDDCNQMDLAIHVTGYGLADVDRQASGGLYAINLDGGMAIAEFQSAADIFEPDDVGNTTIMARVLGQMMISASHEDDSFCNVNFNTGPMCAPPNDLDRDVYTLIPSFKAACSSTLNEVNKPSVGVKNVNVAHPEGLNNADFVIITSEDKDETFVNFGCNPTVNDFDISTSISNNFGADRSYSVEIEYNDQYVEILELGADFVKQPYIGNNPAYNAKYVREFMKLEIGQRDLNVGSVKIKGSGLINDIGSNAQVNILYRVEPKAKLKNPKENISNIFPSNQKNILFIYRYNHQLDRRNQSVVKTSELDYEDPSEILSPLNFCNQTKYDIYIDGTFEVDRQQRYCNTNFYFGPNAKVVINNSTSLTLNNCLLTTCGTAQHWKGIEVMNGGGLLLNNTKVEKAEVGIFSEGISSDVAIVDNSAFTQCDTGIYLKNSSLFPLQKSSFSNNNTAIILDECPPVFADKCSFVLNRIGIDAQNTTVLTTSDFSGHATSRGIVHNGVGAQELFVPEGTYEGMQIGITSNNTRLVVGSSPINKPNFKQNFIGIFKGSAPNLSHNITASTFDENEYGVIIANNSLGRLSYITGQNRFVNNKYGILVSNSAQGKGWYINKNTFEVPWVGVKTSRSDKVDVDNNNFTAMVNSRFSAAKDMVVIEGGRDNKVQNNSMDHLSNGIESAQMRNIYVANATNTQVHCNILDNGTYGLNVWGAAPSLISANTFRGSHTGMYYGLFPENGNVATGPQTHYGNIWEKNPPFLSSFGAKHLSQDPLVVNNSTYTVDQDENPKFNTDFIAVTDWIQNNPIPSASNDCENPPLSVTSGNAGNGSRSGGGSGGTMALSIFNDEVPFTDYSVPLNQALDQQLYTSILNGDNQGLNSNQINAYMTSISNTAVGTIAQANYLMSQPIVGSGQVSTYSEQLHTLMEAYYIAETNNDPNASTIRSQINALSSTLSDSYKIYLTHLHNRIDQVQYNISPLLESNDPYIYAQANLMQLSLKQLNGDSLNQIDISNLTQIANMCPLEGGDAVYGARGMLDAHLLTNISYNDHQLCVVQTSTSSSIKDIENTLYPNPTTGLIKITNAQSIREIAIVDAFNRTWRNINQNISDKSDYSLNLEDLSSGIYFIKLLNHDLTSSVHKVVIVR